MPNRETMCVHCKGVANSIETRTLSIITLTETKLTPYTENNTISYDKYKKKPYEIKLYIQKNLCCMSQTYWYQTVFLFVIIYPFLHHCEEVCSNCHSYSVTSMNRSVVMWGLLRGLKVSLIEILTEALPAIITKCGGQHKRMEGKP